MRCIMHSLFFLCCIFTLHGKALLEYSAMPERENIYPENVSVVPLADGGIRFLPREGAGFCYVDLPLPRKQLDVCDWIIFDFACENANANIGFEMHMSSPKGSRQMKRTFRLEPGRRKYKHEIDSPGIEKPVSHIRLLLKNKISGKPPCPVTLYGITLSASGAGLPDALDLPVYSRIPDTVQEKLVQKRKLLSERYGNLRKIAGSPQESPALRLAALYDLYNMNFSAAAEVERIFLDELLKLQGGIVYGCSTGADKIYRQQKFPGNFLSDATIELAGNESEGTQIALYSSVKRNHITVEVSTLKHESDASVIPSENISVAPIGYVKILPPDYPVRRGFLHPDPILTYLQEFSIEAKHFQPVWLDVSVPAEQKPGKYRGEVLFRESGRPLLKVPLTVRVWNFSLPARQTLPRVFTNDLRLGTPGKTFETCYTDNPEAAKEAREFMFSEKRDKLPDSEEARRLISIADAGIAILQNHGIPNDNFYRSLKDPIPGWQRLEHAGQGALFCLGYDNYNLNKEIALLKPQAEAMKQEDSLSRAYIYGYDEITRPEDYEKMRKHYGLLKKHYPQIRRMTTAHDPSCGKETGTRSLIDIWAFQSPTYMRVLKNGNADEARRTGMEVWWYTCNWPFPPYANFLVENTATATRLLPGFMSWYYRAQGFLYYGANVWRVRTFGEETLETLAPYGKNASLLNNSSIPSGRTFRLAPAINSPAEIRGKGAPKQQLHTMLSLEFEYKTGEKGKITDFSAEVTVRSDKKNETFKFDLSPSPGWKNQYFRFYPSAPVKTVHFTLKLTGQNVKSEVRKISICTLGEDRRIMYPLKKTMSGGPVVDMEYFPNMVGSTGDGALILPSTDGIVPTIRLKFIRDGFEDYEYLALLRKYMEEACKNPGKAEWLHKARKVLKEGEALCPALNQYTQKGIALLGQRRQIALLLEEYRSLMQQKL